MKRFSSSKLAASALFLCLTSASSMWGAVMVSNLEDETFSTFPISFWWAGNRFITDNSAASFSLDSVTLSMAIATATPGGFFVAIYSDGSGEPGTLLETLSGSSNPAAAGDYTYTSSGLGLAPNTSYWVVAGVTGASAPGGPGYLWDVAGAEFDFTGPWQIPAMDTHITSFDAGGANWNDLPNDAFPRQFSVSATAVPEPAAVLLVGVGLGAAFLPRSTKAQAPTFARNHS